jgi:hypothetical protein
MLCPPRFGRIVPYADIFYVGELQPSCIGFGSMLFPWTSARAECKAVEMNSGRDCEPASLRRRKRRCRLTCFDVSSAESKRGTTLKGGSLETGWLETGRLGAAQEAMRTVVASALKAMRGCRRMDIYCAADVQVNWQLWRK